MSPYRETQSSSSMFFASDNEDMEDASVLSSPPRSGHRARSSESRYTPKSRRLFDEENGPQQRLSPPRRPTLKPLDLNHDLEIEEDQAQPQGGRKRSSAERRGDGTPTNKMDSSSDSDQTMYTSPHISPNSFITMDGRFVQSKNPFSSPMVMEDEAPPAQAAVMAPAPSLPVTFGESKMPGFLPPRHSRLPSKREATETAASPPAASVALLNSNGYPDKRFTFTGSPIKEDSVMETDTATSGSLHKVRRLHRSDDIVAACGQHLNNHRQELSIDTTAQAKNAEWGEETDISPTDVLSFPPTPIKARPPQTPYAARTPFRRRPARTPLRSDSHDDDDDDDEQQQKPKSRFYSDFDVIGELGKGSFGTVYKVLSRLDGCMYAIKAALRKAKGMADRDRMLKEVYALAALSDQADTATFHIVRYHQAWMEDDRLYIQTELCTGNLTDEIAKRHMTLQRRYKLLREICLALEFIHKSGMVHLDLKPDNVFVKNDQFKLGDFGLVTKTSNHQDVEEGDSRYMSMELLSGDHADLTKSDIFSLGATMYEICLGRPLPMNGPEWQDIRAGRLQPLPGTDPDLVSLIQQMLHPQASCRPTASELLKRRQLLSDEQKALEAAKSKVAQANLELAAQAQKWKKLSPPPRKGLQRANTWNGSSLPYL